MGWRDVCRSVGRWLHEDGKQGRGGVMEWKVKVSQST